MCAAGSVGLGAVRPHDRLRYRLPSFQVNVRRAEQVIAQALAVMRQPYVAFSGGKDSLVVLALVRRQRPDIAVVWSDDELEYPEQPGYITGLAAAWGLNLKVVCSHALHAEWFRTWTDRPFWREPLAGAVMLPDSEPLTDDWLMGQGFDGVFLGLRAQERFKRRMHLAHRGLLTETARGWQCNPIGWRSVDDVWAFIAGEGLPYNPVYDVLSRIGVERAKQRVGPLPLTPGWQLRRGWPGLVEALTERYGPQWSC